MGRGRPDGPLAARRVVPGLRRDLDPGHGARPERGGRRDGGRGLRRRRAGVAHAAPDSAAEAGRHDGDGHGGQCRAGRPGSGSARRGGVAADPATAERLAHAANWTVDLISLAANLFFWAYAGMIFVVVAVLI